MFKVNKNDTRTTPSKVNGGFEPVYAGRASKYPIKHHGWRILQKKLEAKSCDHFCEKAPS